MPFTKFPFHFLFKVRCALPTLPNLPTPDHLEASTATLISPSTDSACDADLMEGEPSSLAGTLPVEERAAKFDARRKRTAAKIEKFHGDPTKESILVLKTTEFRDRTFVNQDKKNRDESLASPGAGGNRAGREGELMDVDRKEDRVQRNMGHAFAEPDLPRT
ncbi:hypothetical protein HDU97_008134 [Phlyctochytrium planicorne]|nr:hypothetical protein HDU97_008134 [Phlyctochytrium planicorne]